MQNQISSPKLTPNLLSISWRVYVGLCKLKVVSLIVFTAFVGMLLTSLNLPPFDKVVLASLGIGLAAAAAAAINHILDRHADALMRRTAYRPIPTGEISPRHALQFATILCVLSLIILVFFINLLTAVLTFLSLIGYAVIYTQILKRLTPQNIVIGGAAGAAPPLLGWTAMTGEISAEACLLFLIIFVWTPPHFWSLAIHRKAEYAKVDIPMLPVTHGIDFTRLHVLLYTILLCLVTLLPYLSDMSGLIYLSGTLILNGIFLYYAFCLYYADYHRYALPTFVYSINYLMILFALLLVDHYAVWYFVW